MWRLRERAIAFFMTVDSLACLHFRVCESVDARLACAPQPLRGAGMNVLVFASRKGGSGKRPLAAHLAPHTYKPSRPCLLVDDDPQGSLRLWNLLRNYDAMPLKTVERSMSD